MDSDDIYKAIGYTVAVMFFIYIIVRVLNLQFDIVSGIKKKVDEGFKEGRKEEDDDEDDEDDNKKSKKEKKKTSESQQTKIDEYLDGIEKRNDKKAIGFAKNQSKFKAALAEEMSGCEYDILNILIQTGKKGELSDEGQKKISALKIKLEACQAVHQGI